MSWEKYVRDVDNEIVINNDERRCIANFIQRNIFNPKRVLEIGCSNGRWLRWFKKKYNCEVFGLDNVSHALPFVENGVTGDGFSLPFKGDSFDVVVTLGLIEHFKNPYPILMEAKRVLKHKGKLIIETPNMDLSLRYFYTKLRDMAGISPAKHYRINSKRSINFCRDLDLKIIEYEFCGSFFERFKRFRLLHSVVPLLDTVKIISTRDLFMLIAEK